MDVTPNIISAYMEMYLLGLNYINPVAGFDLKDKQSVNENVTQSKRIFTEVKIETRPIVCMLGIPQL